MKMTRSLALTLGVAIATSTTVFGEVNQTAPFPVTEVKTSQEAKIEAPSKKTITLETNRRVGAAISNACGVACIYALRNYNSTQAKIFKAALLAEIALLLPDICLSDIDADTFFSKEVVIALAEYIGSYGSYQLYNNELPDINMLIGSAISLLCGTVRLAISAHYFMNKNA